MRLLFYGFLCLLRYVAIALRILVWAWTTEHVVDTQLTLWEFVGVALSGIVLLPRIRATECRR